MNHLHYAIVMEHFEYIHGYDIKNKTEAFLKPKKKKEGKANNPFILSMSKL